MNSEDAIRFVELQKEIESVPDDISAKDFVSLNVKYAKMTVKEMDFATLEATRDGLYEVLAFMNAEINRRVEAVEGKQDA